MWYSFKRSPFLHGTPRCTEHERRSASTAVLQHVGLQSCSQPGRCVPVLYTIVFLGYRQTKLLHFTALRCIRRSLVQIIIHKCIMCSHFCSLGHVQLANGESLPARGTSSTPAAFKPACNALLVVYSLALATQPSEKSRCSISICMG